MAGTESTTAAAPTRQAGASASLCLVRAVVGRVRTLSPNFVRITFTGDSLTEFGNPGETFDQRIKLIFPAPSGALPEVGDTADWYTEWLSTPEASRGSMRTYSVRDVRVGDDGATEVDVDFVLHLVPGKTGPASSWAAAATVGDEVIAVGPRRGAVDGGGIEYRPRRAARVLLAGDETAAPAIARILEDAPAGLLGAAFIEVPTAADAQPINGPDGVAVHWLAREGAEHGDRLHRAVAAHLGEAAGSSADTVDAPDEELVWETPTFSRLGEQIDGRADDSAARYYWIAGESRMVTTLRRRLVKDLGVPRAHVAFMGYWREGVAMKG